MKVIISFLLLAIPVELAAQARLIETVKPEPGRLTIPYSKYVLPNGLTLIVSEDRSDPVVTIEVRYRVGSAREDQGKSGFAHLFEHMMFAPTEHVVESEGASLGIYTVVTQAGGNVTGTTSRDQTRYYETVPRNLLERVLWLEADRMGFMHDSINPAALDRERAVVKNERGQNVDNLAYGRVNETILRHLYPYGHPYSRPVLGTLEDLDQATLDDVRKFLLRWYGPNNAILTVVGDVETSQVVAMVQKYFGPIVRGPDVRPAQVPPTILDRDRHVTLVENLGRQPRLVVAYPAAPLGHADEPLLACLVRSLNAFATERLIRTQRVRTFNAVRTSYELAGELRLTVNPAAGVSLTETKRRVDEMIRDFSARGITDDDVARFAGSQQSEWTDGMEYTFAKLSTLAGYEWEKGNPNHIERDFQRYTSVTKEAVAAMLPRYIKERPAVILSVVPRADQDDVAAVQDHVVDSGGFVPPDYGYASVKYSRPVDNFDRSIMPGPGPNPAVKVPAFWRSDLPGGIRILGSRDSEGPIVSLAISIPGGRLADAEAPAKSGRAALFARMMSEDTANRTAEQVREELQKLGSYISIYLSGDDSIEIDLSALKKNLPATLALLEERLLHPKFTSEAFGRVKNQMLDNIRNAAGQPADVAADVFAGLEYGPGTILSVRPTGTAATVGALTLADVDDYYRRFMTKRGARIIVGGDVSQAEIVERLGFIGKLPDLDVKLPAPPLARPVDKTRIYLVDLPGSAQTFVNAGYNLSDLQYDLVGDYYRATLMAYPLGGGGYTSRLSRTLRGGGFLYRLQASVVGSAIRRAYVFSAGIRADGTDTALSLLMGDLEKYARDGVTEAELAVLKRTKGQDEALKYEGLWDKASFMDQILRLNLPGNFIETQQRILAGITKPEIDALAKKYIRPGQMNIVVVGDKATVLRGLQKLPYEIVELDVDGRPVTAK